MKAVDASGNVYVADTGNHRIQKFSSTGVFITKWGSFGSENGQFFSPMGIEVDASGDVYIADTGNHRIQKFRSNGIFNAFIVSAISNMTNESGTQATFTVRLNFQPTDDVTLPVVSSDLSEGTVSTFGLTFTDQNWNVDQTVTVTGVDDSLDDGDQDFTIILGPASSSDTNYNGEDPADVSVTNEDDDSAGFTVSPISGNTSENGTQATFTVKLNTQPTNNVTIPVSSSDVTEGIVSTFGLTFTDQNWNVNQTVTVTGLDDAIVDGNQAYTIILGPAASNDTTYNGENPNDVAVTNEDDDFVGFTISPISGNTSENGTHATFTVKLNSQPSDNVTISVSSNDTTEGMASTPSLIFTPANWNVNKTVTVTGIDDAIIDGNQNFTIILDPATSTDANYNGLDPADVSVTNIDNDAGITVNIDTTSPGSANRIDGHDVYLFSLAFGSSPISPDWNPACDFNMDSIIDGNDLVILAANFGKKN